MRLGLVCALAFAHGVLAVGAPQEGFVVRQGDDWAPIEIKKDILEGSALDFSLLGLQDAPAGKHGRVRDVDGHFEFERLPGVMQRFYGANLCFTACFPEHAVAERLARRFAQTGYNAVRIHHYDRQTSERACVKDSPDGELLPDEENLDRLDYLVAQMIRRGIYLTTDLYVSRSVSWRQIGEDREGVCPFKTLVLLHEGAYANWCRFTRILLTHRNPYTGRTWAEEPALLFLPLINEGRFPRNGWDELRGLPCVKELYAEWLRGERAKEPAAYPEVKGEEPPDLSALHEGWHPASVENFQAWAERRFFARASRFLRDELGCKALLTNDNCSSPASWTRVREECFDLVDNHRYVDHAHFLGKKWGVPLGCSGVNPLRRPDDAIFDIGGSRVFGKPFTVTEWNWCYPGRHRAGSGLAVGAFASVQDWSGLWRFAYAHRDDKLGAEAHVIGWKVGVFDICDDPVQLLAERAGAALFLRGELKPHEKALARVIRAADERPSAGVRSPGSTPPWMSLGWRARIGVTSREEGVPGATSVPFAVTNAVDAQALAGGLPSRADCALDAAYGSLAVSTPRMRGVYAEKGTVAAEGLRVAVSGAPAAVWVTSVDGRPLAESGRMLAVHLTDVQNTDTEIDGKWKKLTKIGKLPLQARVGNAQVELDVAGRNYAVWALDLAGRRVAPVPCEVADGKLRFVTRVDRTEGATFAYEIMTSPAETGNCLANLNTAGTRPRRR